MVTHLAISAEMLYLLIEKIDKLVQEHNQVDPEAFMPKVTADEYYRGTPEWSLALEWRTRQGVASFNLHANSQRVCMNYIFLKEAMNARSWAETLHHPGKRHWNVVIDYIASLGDFSVWGHELQLLRQALQQRRGSAELDR
ncbi:MAG: hypothetical protein U1F68_08335 [Gammaproteobacteria bacterium]